MTRLIKQKILWKVILVDGTEIVQITNQKNTLKQIDRAKIVKFKLLTTNYQIKAEVDCKKGSIIIPNKLKFYLKGQEFSLIYFKRHTYEIAINTLQALNHNMIIFVGLQEITSSNTKIFMLDECGDFIGETNGIS